MQAKSVFIASCILYSVALSFSADDPSQCIEPEFPFCNPSYSDAEVAVHFDPAEVTVMGECFTPEDYAPPLSPDFTTYTVTSTNEIHYKEEPCKWFIRRTPRTITVPIYPAFNGRTNSYWTGDIDLTHGASYDMIYHFDIDEATTCSQYPGANGEFPVTVNVDCGTTILLSGQSDIGESTFYFLPRPEEILSYNYNEITHIASSKNVRYTDSITTSVEYRHIDTLINEGMCGQEVDVPVTLIPGTSAFNVSFKLFYGIGVSFPFISATPPLTVMIPLVPEYSGTNYLWVERIVNQAVTVSTLYRTIYTVDLMSGLKSNPREDNLSDESGMTLLAGTTTRSFCKFYD